MLTESMTAVLEHARTTLYRTAHVGVLIPWANSVVEAELPRFGLDRVVFHYARLVPASRSTDLDLQFLRELREAVPAALRELSQLPLTGTLLACTSAGFTGQSLSLPVTSAFDALVATLHQMSIDRIVLVTPYPCWVTTIEAREFISRGITVLARSSLNRVNEYSEVSPTEIRNIISQFNAVDLAQAGAIVLSCTGWPTFGLLTELEDRFGIAVLSSNLAMAIHAIIISGIGATK